MLKKIIVLMLIMLASNLFSDVPEKYISIEIQSRSDISELTKLVSIDKREGNIIYAYALPHEIAFLEERGIVYELESLPNNERATLTMATNIEEMSNWDRYPTFEVFLEMMSNFASDYPNLCLLENIGYSQNNRQIPVVKITSNVNQETAKPAFYYSGQMHGDEVVSYILLLRLIDELLSNYGSDQEITDLVNTTEIWINPLANPDGTYYGGNDTVSNARRYLANNLDANRNYIDFIDGYPGTGSSTTVSQENLDQIDFMTGKGIVMSANTHSGQEVVNYPWDTIPGLHPDDLWYQQISRVYADAVHEDAPATYMDGFDDGITNGYEWYEANGTRQDYANYYLGIREITIEHSMVKLLDVSELNSHWTYNRDALIQLMKQVHYGIKGNITDYQGNPLVASVEILNHDIDVTKVRSNGDFGDYYRPIYPGTYDVKISAEGYESQIFNNVVVSPNSSVTLDAVFGQEELSQNIQLNSGWNLISYNLDYEELSPTSIFSDIIDNVQEIKNMTQTYSPDIPYYFNTLDNLLPQEGYWVNVNENSLLELRGNAYDQTSVIELNTGWNLVGYLPQESTSPEIALSSINDKLLQVKDLTSIYNPAMPDVFNTMELMSPSKGYWLEVAESCSLIYNVQPVSKVVRENNCPWNISIYPNNSAIIYAEFETDDFLIDYENDFIGVFSGDECLGAGQLAQYIDNQGNEKSIVVLVVQIPSNQASYNFVYYQSQEGQSLALNQEMTLQTGQVYGQVPDQLISLNYQSTEISNNNVDQVNSFTIYAKSNPFTNILNIGLYAKIEQDLELSLYNLKGQKVATKKLRSLAGQMTDISFNTDKLASGIYFVRTESCRKTSTLKVIKIK